MVVPSGERQTTGREARLAKKMTQQSLATAINEKVPGSLMERSEKGRILWFQFQYVSLTKMQEGFKTPRNSKDVKMHFGFVAQGSVINEYESGKALISLIWSSCLA